MELCDLSAYELALLLKQRKISAIETLDACLQRIKRWMAAPVR